MLNKADTIKDLNKIKTDLNESISSLPIGSAKRRRLLSDVADIDLLIFNDLSKTSIGRIVSTTSNKKIYDLLEGEIK